MQGRYNATLPTIPDGQTAPVQLTQKGAIIATLQDAAGTAQVTTVAQGSTTSGQTGTLVQGAVTTTHPTYTTAQTNPFSLSTVGGLRVEGVAAHDATATGAPFRIAGKVRTSDYSTLIANDTIDLVATATGSLIMRPFSIPESQISYAAAASGISNTTTAVTISAAVASVRNYITSIQISSDALGAATELVIRDGAGGTVLWRMKIGTGGLTGGLVVNLPSPLKSSVNTLLEVATLTASVTGAVYFNAQGYTAP